MASLNSHPNFQISTLRHATHIHFVYIHQCRSPHCTYVPFQNKTWQKYFHLYSNIKSAFLQNVQKVGTYKRVYFSVQNAHGYRSIVVKENSCVCKCSLPLPGCWSKFCSNSLLWFFLINKLHPVNTGFKITQTAKSI